MLEESDHSALKGSRAAEETYAGTLGSVRRLANQCISRQLIQIGRMQIKQILLFKVTYHTTTFIPMSGAQQGSSLHASADLWEAALQSLGLTEQFWPCFARNIGPASMLEMMESPRSSLRLLEPERLV